MKKIIISLYLSLSGLLLIGQQDLVIYHMNEIAQSGYTNPSFRPTAKTHIGLPFISSTYLRHQNTFLNPNSLFEKQGNQTVFRTDHFLSSLKERNYLGFDFAEDIFSLGISVQENYFTLAIRERIFTRFNIPKDFISFPFTGNASFDEIGSDGLDFSDFGIHLNHYREYGLGWQRKLNDQWSVGGRIKYLYGMENIDIKTSDFTWETDPTTYDYNFTGQLEAFTSGFGPLIDETDSIEGNFDLSDEDIGAYFFKRKNRGWGMDLGVNRKVGEKLELSASVVDLGFIKWKTYNKNYQTNAGQFAFDGFYLDDDVIYADSAFADSLEVLGEELWESVKDEFEASENEDAYRSSLQTRIYLGGSYELYQNSKGSGRVGALLQSEIYRGTLRPTFTLSYNQKFQRWLSASVAYSIMDGDFRNLGLGISANAGPIQFYVTADNLLALNMAQMNFGDEDPNELIYPAYSRNVHAHFGINIALGREKKDRDEDGVPDKEDRCPDVPGVKSFNGCPDTDGDQIEDSEDLCPTVKGLKKFNGCPDTDNDGIEDSQDLCPNEKGTEKTQGCPDQDNDGIQDDEDECPKEKGLPQFNGCPDKDEDGIQDSKDDCPDLKGTPEFRGCPDTDKDGISDQEDECPNEAGPKDNNGCPYGDQDKDGINDKMDLCPTVPGVLENNGCPEIKEEEQAILNTAFENLEFVSGKDEIKSSSFQSLNDLSELLIQKEEWKIKISGHTDDVGNDEQNLSLSEKRSKAVASYLESKGVPQDRIQTEWFGESKPIADNSTEEGRQQNRRVEMEILFE